MIALYRPGPRTVCTRMSRPEAGLGRPRRIALGSDACSSMSIWTESRLFAANGHIDETARNIRGNHGYAQAPHFFLNNGRGQFRDVARGAGDAFAAPKVGRGAAYGDFDNDGE